MDASQIREQMTVVGPDGHVVGKVDHVEGNRIKLTKNDSADGMHHYVAIAEIDGIKDGKVCLSKNAQIH